MYLVAWIISGKVLGYFRCIYLLWYGVKDLKDFYSFSFLYRLFSVEIHIISVIYVHILPYSLSL